MCRRDGGRPTNTKNKQAEIQDTGSGGDYSRTRSKGVGGAVVVSHEVLRTPCLRRSVSSHTDISGAVFQTEGTASAKALMRVCSGV